MRSLLGKTIRLIPIIILGGVVVLFVSWQMICYAVHGQYPHSLVVVQLGVALFCLALVIHELGHLAAAWWVGLDILQLRILVIAFVREGENRRWRIRWGQQEPLGFVVALPHDADRLRCRYAIMVLGGPLAGLVVGLLCILLAQALHCPLPPFPFGTPRAWTQVGFLYPCSGWVLLLDLLALFNLLLSLLTLVPHHNQGSFSSDGAQLLALRGGPEVERNLAVGFLGAWMQHGVRPRDWAPALVAQLDPSTGDDREVMVSLYRYYHAVDRGDIHRAGARLDRALALLKEQPIPRASSVFIEAAYFTAFHRGEATQARAWLEQVPPGEQEEHTRLRAEAAVLLADGRPAEAITAAEAGLAAVPRSRDLGGSKAERDQLAAVLAAARAVEERLDNSLESDRG